ncbi:MAG TPA: DUF2231 domain-containing protein [Gammaproteobacteria bacterium]|nr:DUF2231 domain-containing protein [Gammaproteobacteria bacterium]
MIDVAHIHPMLVHFPLALMPLAVVAQLITVSRGRSLFTRSCLANAGILLLALAAAGALAAAVFGDLALDKAVDAGVALSQMEEHEELGMLSAWVLAGLIAVEGWFYYRKVEARLVSIAALLAGSGMLVMLLTTAWFGGNLVYGLGVNVAAGV